VVPPFEVECQHFGLVRWRSTINLWVRVFAADHEVVFFRFRILTTNEVLPVSRLVGISIFSSDG